MTNAYDISYLYDAQSVLGKYMECGVTYFGYELDVFFRLFAKSYIGRLFGSGNPRYIAGVSSDDTAI